MVNRLGGLLRLWRAAKGRTVRRQAALIGVSAATLSRIERGEACDLPSLLHVVFWLVGSDEPDAAPDVTPDADVTGIKFNDR